MKPLSDSARRRSLLALPVAWLGGCAVVLGREPLRASVIDLHSLPAAGFEMRLLVKLRLQNPSKWALPFKGVSLELDLQSQNVASGVSAKGGEVPAFGETLIEVPVTVASVSLLRHVLSISGDGDNRRLRVSCTARGLLSGRPLDSERFEGRSDVEWPPRPAPAPPAG